MDINDNNINYSVIPVSGNHFISKNKNKSLNMLITLSRHERVINSFVENKYNCKWKRSINGWKCHNIAGEL